MTLKELINLKQADWGMSRAEIAVRIGAGYTYFSAILAGTSKMPERTLKNMLERLDFSGCEERWLIAYFIHQSGRLPLSLLSNQETEILIDEVAGQIASQYRSGETS